MADTAIQIGELSRRTGCNIETIRYYERIGLMPPPPRRGRYRCYGGGDVDRLGFVRRARELGFTLDEVRALLGLAAGGNATCADLKRMERVLAESVRACEAGQDPGCPLIQTLYARDRSTEGMPNRSTQLPNA
jgi:MerR family transcriptional regulator, mercuric resistance operon regulatory protein